jgi:hypothetical protein
VIEFREARVELGLLLLDVGAPPDEWLLPSGQMHAFMSKRQASFLALSLCNRPDLDQSVCRTTFLLPTTS